MYQPTYLLPNPINPDFDFIEESRRRWTIGVGIDIHTYIMERIREGAGEDFLQWDYETSQHNLRGFMKDDHDLAGFQIWKEDITFPKGDNFEAIDFSYAEFLHSTFREAVISGGNFRLSRFYNFKFEKCLFAFTNFYGATFEDVTFKECSFVEYNSFINCKFINCKFEGLFTTKDIFHDCLFDVNTLVTGIADEAFYEFNARLEMKDLSSVYKGIKDAYLAGEVFDQYRNYFFLQRKTETRNLKMSPKKCTAWLNEIITGYGVRVNRVMYLGLLIITLFSVLFAIKFCLSTAFVMSVSSFTTLGNIPTESPFDYLYVIEAALGITCFSLFVTVLANIWFGEK